MQGASFSFLTPVITLFSLQEWQCPYARGKYKVMLYFISGLEKQKQNITISLLSGSSSWRNG